MCGGGGGGGGGVFASERFYLRGEERSRMLGGESRLFPARQQHRVNLLIFQPQPMQLKAQQMEEVKEQMCGIRGRMCVCCVCVDFAEKKKGDEERERHTCEKVSLQIPD